MREYHCELRSHDTAGVRMENTFAIKHDPVGPDVSEAPDSVVADGVWSWLSAKYLDCLATEYTVDSLLVRGILGYDSEYEKPIGSSGTFAPTGDPLPREVALCMTFKTTHVGRSGRGRIYIPSPRHAGTLANINQWATSSGSFYGKCQALADQLLLGHDTTWDGGLATGHISLRLWSRHENLTRDVVAIVPRTDPRWLRSRRS